jgi:hypothetical protein
MEFNLNPITWPSGEENMGGYKAFILFIPSSAVSQVPTLSKTPSTETDLVTATGSFTFKKQGDKPKYIECTDKTVKYTAPSQGEIEGQSFAPAGEFFRAGSKKEVASLARQIQNTPGYIVLENMDGDQVMVGQPGLPAHIKAEFDGGMARADRRGFKFSFTNDAVTPIIFLATPIDVQALIES